MTPDGEAPRQAPDTAPAGWYSDPDGQGERYWDGNAWTDHFRSASPPPPSVPQPAQSPAFQESPQAVQAAAPGAPPAFVGPGADVYSEAVDLNQVLAPEQRELYKQHTLTSFPTWAAVVLNVVLFPLTLGLFTLIFNLLRHDRFPKVKPDDPSAGKAIGFMFIPFYNLYWQFVAWPRLAQRINFQRLRGQPPPILSRPGHHDIDPEPGYQFHPRDISYRLGACSHPRRAVPISDQHAGRGTREVNASQVYVWRSPAGANQAGPSLSVQCRRSGRAAGSRHST